MAQEVCHWCGCRYDGTDLSCPACGAASDQRPQVTEAGWTQMPAIRDMARVRFGSSACQIDGDVTPVAEINLAAGDRLYFMHHALLWRDPNLHTSVVTLRSGFKRVLAGMPTFMMQAEGPGRIAFSGLYAGELFAVPLQPGQAIDVREHMLLVADGSVHYDYFDPHVWYVTGDGNDRKTHYPLGPFMDRFQAGDRPGVILLHVQGNVFARDLAEGEELLIQAGSLVYKDPSVNMTLKLDSPSGSSWTPMNFLWLNLRGPGRVAIGSVFAPLHDMGLLRRYHPMDGRGGPPPSTTVSKVVGVVIMIIFALLSMLVSKLSK